MVREVKIHLDDPNLYMLDLERLTEMGHDIFDSEDELELNPDKDEHCYRQKENEKSYRESGEQ